MSVDDETKVALRRVCDRHAGSLRLGHQLSHELVSEILGSFPAGVLDTVAVATSGTDKRGVALNVSPLFYRYVAYAAEYCSRVC